MAMSRNEQTPGAKLSWRLGLVRWRLTSVDNSYA